MPRAVAVVGGGIAGFATALACAKNGAQVTVLERSSAIAEVGAGLQITPNGARVLDALGLGRALDLAGVVATAVVPTDALTGRSIARFSLAAQDPPYRFVHRADLIDMLWLACRAQGVAVRTGAQIARFGPRGPSAPDAAAPGAPDDGSVGGADLADADLVVGADGIRSAARRYLNDPDAPTFSGQVAWRAVVTADHPPEARIWMAPGRHAVSYPLTGGRVNLVAVEERSAWAEEGWHHPDDAANLRAAFSGCAPELRTLLAAVETTHLWGLFRHDVAPIWQDGRVVLVGDAAHPTLPFLAQGANLALEDAAVLVRMLRQHGQGPGLAAYARLRRPRVARAIAVAQANAHNYHLTGLHRRGAHLALGALGIVAPGAFLRRLDWLYGHDATA